jgi:peptidoglycan hydrolase CwlO-like protein|tara:strand:- start:2271 stop:2435 length:165 start_codon:yes stop_codon:yes gene_type:complete
MTSKEIKELEKKIDKLQETVERLENKLNKHIDFIDDTYEGLRNPINAAKKWLGR